MLTILVIALVIVIVASAVAADRSARSQHRLRAIGWNLCGIICLLCGLLTIFAWSRGSVVDMTRRLAVATPSGKTTSVVRLLVGYDGRLERPDQHSAPLDEAVAEAQSPAVEVQAEADDSAAPPLAPPATDPALEPAESLVPDLVEDTHDDAVDWDALEQLDGAEPDSDLAPEQRSQVQIDFDARPAWVEQPEVDKGDIHQISVTAGPYKSLQKARAELSRQLTMATSQYIDEFVGHPSASQWIQFSPDEIHRRLVASDHVFDEQVISPSVGTMYQSHALLEFGPAFHDQVNQAWHQVMARTQLVRVALLGGAILGVLVLLFGYFNADTATRGFYSRRLKFVTIVTILGMIVAGFLFARSIPWLWL